jgi:hypothetical protein
MALQGVANAAVRVFLRTPGISRGIGSRLITVYVVGRKSDKQYAVPVAYTLQGEQLLFGTSFAWGRNLRTGEPVDIVLKGKRRTADVEVFTDEASVVERYATMCRDNKQFAKFNKIGFDAAGNPSAEDLHAAWASGARAFLLTPTLTRRPAG